MKQSVRGARISLCWIGERCLTEVTEPGCAEVRHRARKAPSEELPMRLSTSARAAFGGACHALGGIWTVAGVLRLIFGVRVTFPLLPPVDLEQVDPILALAVGAVLIAAGAWLGRSARAGGASSPAVPASSSDHPELPEGTPPWVAHAAQPRPRAGIRTPPA